MKIVRKISLSFLTVALILASVSATIFYKIAKDSLQKSIYNNLNTAVASRFNHLETYLEMLKISVGQLSRSQTLEDFLKVNAKGGLRQGEAFELAMKRLKRTKEANPSIAEFLLLDKTGKVVVSSNESSIGLDKSTDCIFLGAQNEVYIKDVYYSEIFKEPLIGVSAPFLDSQTGEFLGVLAARVRLNGLNNIVTEKTGMGKTGEIYIVNKYGFMITPSRFIKDTVLKQRVDTENVRRVRLHKGREHVLSQKKMTNVFSNYRGVQVLGAHEYIPQMRWGVLAEIETREVFASLVELRLIFVAVLFIVPLAAWLLGIGIAKAITESLHRLHKGVEIVGNGNLDYKVGIVAKDEVGQLSREFDKMAESLKNTTTSIERLNKEITERKKAEEAIVASENKYKQLFEASNDAIIIAEPKTKMFIDCNKKAEELSGYTKQEFLSMRVDQFHPEDRLIDTMEVFNKQAAGMSIIVETEILTKDKKRVAVSINAAAVVIGGERLIMGVFRNISTQKKAEEDLRQSALKLQEQVEKLNQVLKEAEKGR